MEAPVRAVDTTFLQDGSLKVEILPPRNKAAYTFIVILAISGIAALAGLQFVMMRQAAMHHPSPTAFIRMMQVGEVLALGCLMAVLLTGKDALIVNSQDLVIQRTVLGVKSKNRRFQTQTVTNLRFEQWQETARQRSIGRSGLRFEVGQTTETFGNTLSKEQVDDIIGRMKSVYPFPES